MKEVTKIIKKTFFGISCFIDILGFGKKVQSVKDHTELLNVKKELDIVRKCFEIDDKSKLKKDYQKVSGQKEYAFSDSLIFFVSLQSEAIKYSGEFDTIMGDLASIAVSQFFCTLQEVFIRGGIGLGWAYENKGVFISDALVRAVDLEKRIKFPIIAVEESIYNRYYSSIDRKHYSKEYDPFNNGFFRNIEIDGCKYWYLNYLYLGLKEASPSFSDTEKKQMKIMNDFQKDEYINITYHNIQLDWLLRHKECILNARKGTTSTVKEKYDWLIEYHNSIAKNYLELSPNVVI